MHVSLSIKKIDNEILLAESRHIKRTRESSETIAKLRNGGRTEVAEESLEMSVVKGNMNYLKRQHLIK